MSDETVQPTRQSCWAECCGCAPLFRAFRYARHPAKVLLAFCGIFGTYLTGRILDGVWAEGATPVVAVSDGMTELHVFASGGTTATKDWIAAKVNEKDARREGAFAMLLGHGRHTANLIAASVLSLDTRGLMTHIALGFMGLLWLAALHPLYAILFYVLAMLIWGLFGGAVCRMAAMHATRDERLSMGEALAFARKKLGSFFVAPLMPVGILLFFAVMLFLAGLVGAIPAIGEVLVGLLFFLVLLAGFVLAFILVGAAAGGCMMFPTIAAEGSDAFDAISRTFSYVYQRPWRTALYYLLSIAYGSLCFLFAKFFVRLLFWSAHLFLSVSMNWGSAAIAGDAPAPGVGKLDAIWQAPSLTGASPFYGTFDQHALSGMSWLGQWLVKAWVYITWGLLAALVVSLFYCSSTLIYLLLRRDVDATDLEEVFVEDVDEGPSQAADAGASGTSLPVLGQS